jgi:glucans biosynthesis protein C
MAAPASQRHYGMDWLRIGAFGLLILFHVGLMFAPWNFPKEIRPDFEWVMVPLVFTNAWRLSLLFAISGYASAALLARENKVVDFLKSRLVRLGIPLLFGIAFITSPQSYAELTRNHGYEHGFGHFLLHDYFSFQQIDGVTVPAWIHLWFVGYLLAYTFVLGAFWALPAGVRSGLRGMAEKVLATAWLIPIGIVAVFLARLLPPGWSDTHAFFDDGAAHAVYLPTFLFGALLRRSEQLRLAILRQWPVALALGLVAYAIVAVLQFRYVNTARMPVELYWSFLVARAVQSWGMIIALFGIAERYWNRDGAWRATLAEAVFPFYIVHQTIVILVGFWISQFALGAPVEFAILIAATVVGCWAFYLIGREIGPLRPLIGLTRHKRVHATRGAAVPAE